MNLHNHQEADKQENKFLIWIWFLVALFINFAFILLAGWLAFINVTTDSISASMLAGSAANYGVTDYTIQFAPISQEVINEIERDARALQVTPSGSSGIGDDIVQFPPTTTPVPPTQSPTMVSTAETAVSATPTPISQSPTATATLSGNTATPNPLATEETVTPTIIPPFITPTITPTSQPGSTPTPQPTNTPAPQSTNTPIPPPTNTPVPSPTNTPVPPPTNTPVPPTSTPIPPTNTPIPPPTATPVFGITPLPTTNP